MRIWSIHPKHLDRQGLLAMWRETLLAQKVLEGKTKGYQNHSQLVRFKALDNPLDGIRSVLATLVTEANARGYKFDASKIGPYKPAQLNVTNEQCFYEADHLQAKLEARSPEKHAEFVSLGHVSINPVFNVVDGPVESWEKVA